MRTYPALGLMARHGGVLAVIAGGGVLLLCFWAGLLGTSPLFCIVAGLAAGGGTAALLLVMRDIVRIIADTLVPEP